MGTTFSGREDVPSEPEYYLARQQELGAIGGEWQSVQQEADEALGHINFFITDCVAKKECKIVWIPCEDMVVDYLTKSLYGSKF